MGILFDEVDDYYTVTDAAELTLPDAAWCIGVWTYVSDNAGNYFQYLLSNGTLSANSTFNLVLGEAGSANANQWFVRAVDADGTAGSLSAVDLPGADSIWRLIIVQRDEVGGDLELWFCEPKGGATLTHSIAIPAGFDIVNSAGNLIIGARADLNADRFYGSTAAEIFKGNFALTEAQIEALAWGLPIKTLAAQLGYTLDLYLPMWHAEATLIDFSGSGNNAARTGAPATTAHPPICTPIKRRRM